MNSHFCEISSLSTILYLWLLVNSDLNVRVWALEPVSFLLNTAVVSVLSMSGVQSDPSSVRADSAPGLTEGLHFESHSSPSVVREMCGFGHSVLSLTCIQLCFKLPVTHSSWQELILGSSCSVDQNYPGKWGQSGETQHFPPRLLIIWFPSYCSSVSIRVHS